MPVKLRLTRQGRKRYAYYHIVVADSRAPRDGRYIERIGSYNPNTNPATIDLDFDKAYDWLVKGAQPTDTVRTILSYKGVLYKKHLAGGVKKGAFDEEEAEKRLEKWMAEKEAKIQAKIDRLAGDADAEIRKQLEAETKIKEERAAAIAAKNAELAGEAEAEVAEEEAETEETQVEEAAAEVEAEVEKPTEEPKVEEKEAEAPEVDEEAEKAIEEVETKDEEKQPEAKVKEEEKKEEAPKAEKKAEPTPKKEETPKAEVKPEATSKEDDASKKEDSDS